MYFYLFTCVFVIFCVLFSAHLSHHQTAVDGDSEDDQNKPTVIGSIWRLFGRIFAKFDAFVDQMLLSSAAKNCTIRTFMNFIDCILRKSCQISRNDSFLEMEIETLTEQIYNRYIESWHQFVDLKVGLEVSSDDTFKATIRRHLRTLILNFYVECKQHVSVEDILVKFATFLEEISSGKIDARRHDASVDGEVSFLVDSLDALAVRVVPAELRALLLTCSCCSSGQAGASHCLEHSDNVVRLFVYNLIVHGLFIPVIERISSPEYLAYQLVRFLAFFGCPSHDDLVKHIKRPDISGGVSLDAAAEVIEEAITSYEQSFDFFPDSGEHSADLSLYEAIEDSSQEYSIFSDIRIVDVKISTNVRGSQFVDYVILFNVLEFDDSASVSSSQQWAQQHREIPLVNRTYQIKRRFREFLDFQHKLEKTEKFKVELARIKNRPSNIQLSSETILDRFRLKRITEDSSVVHFRRQYLETYLVSLSKYCHINESNIFADFLGYSHTKVQEMRHLMNADGNTVGDATKRNRNERGFVKLIDFFKLFMPLQSKVGHLTTEINDVVVDEAVSEKYSITNIEMYTNIEDELMLKHKLDTWYDSRQASRATYEDAVRVNNEEKLLPVLPCQSQKISFGRIVQPLLSIVMFSWLPAALILYVRTKLDLYAEVIQRVYRRVWSIDRVWTYYFHRCHLALDTDQLDEHHHHPHHLHLDDDCEMTFDEFSLHTENLRFDDIIRHYCDLNRQHLDKNLDKLAWQWRLTVKLFASAHRTTNVNHFLKSITDLFHCHEQNKYYCYLLIDLFVKQFP